MYIRIQYYKKTGDCIASRAGGAVALAKNQ